MKKFIPLASVLALPVLAFAQDFTYVNNVFSAGKGVLGGLINILMIGAFLWFLWTVVVFMKADAAKKAEARDRMLWGILGLFIMTSVWGIIGILRQTTQAGQGGTGALTCPPGTTNVGNKCV